MWVRVGVGVRVCWGGRILAWGVVAAVALRLFVLEGGPVPLAVLVRVLGKSYWSVVVGVVSGWGGCAGALGVS